jgi:hypothetical protein
VAGAMGRKDVVGGPMRSSAKKERSRKSKPQAVRTSPCDSQSYDALKVSFSATLGEEPEVEVGLV